MGHGLGNADHRSPSLWPGPPFSHRQLFIDFPHGGRSAVWGRSLALRNKPHCSSRSHAFLPLIFLLQPLAFLLVLLLFLQCKSISCLSVTKVDMPPASPLNSGWFTRLTSQFCVVTPVINNSQVSLSIQKRAVCLIYYYYYYNNTK